MLPYLSLNGQTSSTADVYLIVSSFAVTQHFLQSATKSAGQQDRSAQQQQLIGICSEVQQLLLS
jgi:hypothetical protein